MVRLSKSKWLMAVCIILFMLVMGCSQDDGQQLSPVESNNKDDVEEVDAKQPEAEEGNNIPDPPKEVELIMYTDAGDNEQSVHTHLIEPLMEKHPHIKMSMISGSASEGTSLPEMMTSNIKIDIYYHGRGPFEQRLEDFGLMYDMTDLIAKHDFDISQLEPTSVEAIKDRFDGKIYGLPLSLNSMVVFYNKDLFDQFGQQYPTDGMLWDEVMEIAKVMTRTEGDKRYYGFGIGVVAQALSMSSLSIPFSDITNNKPTINTNELWRKQIQTEFLNAPMVEAYRSLEKIPNRAMFEDDANLAILLASSGTARSSSFATEVDWDMISLPLYDHSYTTGSRVTPTYYGVTSLSDHPDEAMQAIKFWLSEEFQIERSKSGNISTLRTEPVIEAFATETNHPDKNWGAITYYDFSPLAPMAPYDNNIRSVIGKHLPSIISGEVDLNTGLRIMEDEAQTVINEYLSTR